MGKKTGGACKTRWYARIYRIYMQISKLYRREGHGDTEEGKEGRWKRRTIRTYTTASHSLFTHV